MLPIFPLDLVLFPGETLPLHIFEPRYREMVAECIMEKLPFGIVRGKDETIADVGCTAEIIRLAKKYDDGRMDIEVAGRRRFEILRTDEERSFLRAEILFQDDEPGSAPREDVKRALALHVEIVQLIGPNQSYEPPDTNVPQLSYALAGSLPIDPDFKQTLLAMRSEQDRIAALLDFYQQVLPKLKRAARVREKAGGNGHVM
ncbi:MAG TPA: LON peptidase substrate-binding domain-containing protein [Terriglobales bacterium]|nr:LON peptidase substrate-binding domain-containing protein [Terriglobales bacterium]